MNVFYIIANSQKPDCASHARKIQKYLEENGKICYIQTADLPEERGEQQTYEYTKPGRALADVEGILVLGGDGTLLRASRELTQTHVPLLGINMGTLGYLAEIELANVYPALDRLMRDDYSIEERMMLSGSVLRQGKCLMKDIALNDIVIGRRGHLRVVDFNIYVNETFLCAYRADGIILSTATGSTGYSLSAGGPIVSPDAQMILMTAIAPHTLNSRPIVLPADVEVAVQIGGRDLTEGDGAEVTFDGDTVLALRVGDRIVVSRAHRGTKLVKINNTSFVEILRNKMN